MYWMWGLNHGIAVPQNNASLSGLLFPGLNVQRGNLLCMSAAVCQRGSRSKWWGQEKGNFFLLPCWARGGTCLPWLRGYQLGWDIAGEVESASGGESIGWKLKLLKYLGIQGISVPGLDYVRHKVAYSAGSVNALRSCGYDSVWHKSLVCLSERDFFWPEYSW